MKSWRDNIRNVVPYTPGEQPKEDGVIKLNTNENPYPPSPKVLEAINHIKHLRKYPDPAAADLTEAISSYYGLNRDEVFVGVGSDDVLAIAFLTFFNSGKPVFFPDITYSFYDVWASLFQIPYETKALDEEFGIHAGDYYGENGGVIFPNPNAPTGALLELETVRDILDHNRDVLVIVDEAYIDFGGESARSLIPEYDNLLVVQTYSKSRSLAGLRIGYAMGNKELIKAMNDVKYSFNSYTMNEPAIVMGKAAIEDEKYFQKTREKIINTREWFQEELRNLGFAFADSKANFVFASHESIPAKELFEAAKREKIYIRYFDKPRIDNYLRITIGTDDEMQTLAEFLKKQIMP